MVGGVLFLVLERGVFGGCVLGSNNPFADVVTVLGTMCCCRVLVKVSIASSSGQPTRSGRWHDAPWWAAPSASPSRSHLIQIQRTRRHGRIVQVQSHAVVWKVCCTLPHHLSAPEQSPLTLPPPHTPPPHTPPPPQEIKDKQGRVSTLHTQHSRASVSASKAISFLFSSC